MANQKYMEAMQDQKTARRNRQENKIKSKKTEEKEISQYTQDFIPVKDIRNGIIETTDKRYLKIIELDPINFLLRSPFEQYIVISGFQDWLKISRIRLQFKSITRKADTEKHISFLKKDMSLEYNQKTIELINNYINLVRDVGSNDAVTRRFFIIMEYESDNNLKNGDEYNNIYQSLTSAANTAKNYLQKSCGNNIIQHKDEDLFLAEVLYLFFNRRSSIKETFRDRMTRVIKDTMITKNRIYEKDEIPSIPIVNYIAPRGLDLNHANYIIMDGLYYTYIYIKSNGYIPVVRSGWMSPLVNLGEGIDIDFFLKKEDKSRAKEKVAYKTRMLEIKLKNEESTSTAYEDIENSVVAGYFFKRQLSDNSEDLWYMNTLITISASTYSNLISKKRAVEENLRSMDIVTRSCTLCQEQGLKSSMPFLTLDKDIFRKSKRNLTTSSAASAYMFTAFEMSDDNGILLGVSEQNSSLCIIDIFNSKLYKNANICILGTSGSGKTFTLQLMALRMRMRGIQVFILAPLKGYEFRRASKEIGGSYIKISPGSPHCINILDIRIPNMSSDILIEGAENILEDSLLSRKLQQLQIFFNLLIPDMSVQEKQLLDDAIIECYARKGIFHANKTLYKSGTTILKEMPILKDLWQVLCEGTETSRLAISVNTLVNGLASSFNGQTNVELDNKYIVLDISELKGEILPVGMFIALDFIWDKVKEDKTKKKAIFIDETWRLISQNKFAAEFVLEIFKIIRGYGGSAIAATQDLSDFFSLEDGKYGKGIVNASNTKIILNLEKEEAMFVKATMSLSREEVKQILSFERGQALLASHKNKIVITIKPSDIEYDLITTDRSDLDKQAQKQKEQEQKQEKIAADKILLEKK